MHPRTSAYKGVSFDKRISKWRSQISIDKEPFPLGIYDTEIEAALAYDEEAVLRFGPDARLNFAKKHALTGPGRAVKTVSFEGLKWNSEKQRWIATFQGIKLGEFKDELEALQAIDDAVLAIAKAKDCFRGK